MGPKAMLAEEEKYLGKCFKKDDCITYSMFIGMLTTFLETLISLTTLQRFPTII